MLLLSAGAVLLFLRGVGCSVMTTNSTFTPLFKRIAHQELLSLLDLSLLTWTLRGICYISNAFSPVQACVQTGARVGLPLHYVDVTRHLSSAVSATTIFLLSTLCSRPIKSSGRDCCASWRICFPVKISLRSLLPLLCLFIKSETVSRRQSV